MTNSDFTGFYLITGYEPPVVKKVVGQFVREGNLHLVVQHPETRGCEMVELDTFEDDDLFAAEDHAFALARAERLAARNASLDDGETEEAA